MSKLLVLSIISSLICAGCTKSETSANLELKVKSLEKDIEDLKPGLGDIMSVIQSHHAKLFFAGKNENWELAKFEHHEIEEGFESASRWHEIIDNVSEPTAQLLKITESGMQELETAIEEKSKSRFLSAYKNLTTSCNACHAAAAHSFIKIQEPKTLTFTNQRFEK